MSLYCWRIESVVCASNAIRCNREIGQEGKRTRSPDVNIRTKRAKPDGLASARMCFALSAQGFIPVLFSL